MNLPKVEMPEKYVGLYAVDFGSSSEIGLTASQVAELLESEKNTGLKVYKIHNVRPDGTFEIKGITAETFQLEKGMFFYAYSEQIARAEFNRLVDISTYSSPPGKAIVQLARYDEKTWITVLIYPAEYDQEFSQWLIDNDFTTKGEVVGGRQAVTDYYARKAQIIDHHQLLPAIIDKEGENIRLTG